MGSKVTTADLERALVAHVQALRAHGMIGADETVGLDHGSKTYGRAFRLFLKRGSSGAHYSPPMGGSGGYLGMTKADAFDRLTTLTGAIYDVTDLVNRYPQGGAK